MTEKRLTRCPLLNRFGEIVEAHRINLLAEVVIPYPALLNDLADPLLQVLLCLLLPQQVTQLVVELTGLLIIVGHFFVSQTGNDLYLNFTPVPEPTRWVLLSLGLSSVLLSLRRKSQARVVE
ncbi:MAG: PEP-CTERM sorting domain-containing protein [Lacunisphaera sp.]|nr:PEP-CTERM sorting domain-containing protein [Lacunisphaera sp.]